MTNQSIMHNRINEYAIDEPLPSGTPCTRLRLRHVRQIASECSVPLREVEIAALGLGVLPERYLRNYTQYSLEEQKALLESTILVVGLGGLGGHVVDMLARLGVGTIRGADGDVFEAHNLNRQLLSTGARLGLPKVEAAQEHIRAVNSSVSFEGIYAYLEGEAMTEAMQNVDAVVDCLGGLEHRMALQRACAETGKPMITAAIGGYSGYAGVVFPHMAGPAELMGQGTAAEDALGTPSPVVAFAASMEAKACADVLLAKRTATDGEYVTVFDMITMSVETVRFA